MPPRYSPLTAARYAPPQHHPPGESRLLTLRLLDVVPPEVLDGLAARRRLAPAIGPDPASHHAGRKQQFAALDAVLNRAAVGPVWLRTGAVARLVRAELHRAAERQLFGLLAYTVLPNHLHVVVRLAERPPVPLATALHRFKTRTAQLANQALGRDGDFWEPHTHDLPIADAAELTRVVAYVRHDPVRAGLVSEAGGWAHTWLAADFW